MYRIFRPRIRKTGTIGISSSIIKKSIGYTVAVTLITNLEVALDSSNFGEWEHLFQIKCRANIHRIIAHLLFNSFRDIINGDK
jgi:hypothetical protein